MAINREFIPWIIEQAHNGAEVASYCIGAYLLAATALLEGKQCTTHWMHADYFRIMFPNASSRNAANRWLGSSRWKRRNHGACTGFSRGM